VRAEQFDDVALYQTFVLQPLIFLGGRVLWRLACCPSRGRHSRSSTPVYYMIALVRYGFIGYHDVNIGLAFAFLTLATAGGVRAPNYRIFAQGRYLRA